MRRPIIAGNWKMNTNSVEAALLARAVAEATTGSIAEVVVIPPTCLLGIVGPILKGGHVAVGAQNMHPAEAGAFTGEASGGMLKSLGCQYVICGHSERRHIFGESPAWVGEKVLAAHREGLVPILCVGETLAQRDAGETQAVVLGQLEAGLTGLSAAQVEATVVAYEPVWAIGTGRTATPEQAQAVHAELRASLAARAGADVAAKVRIQYGGSVKPTNAAALLGQPDIDGALVGGASLQAESFDAIVQAADAQS